jgi:chemotaxis protein CheX
MPATQEISEDQIHDNIRRAVADVFKTMLSMDAVLVRGTKEAAGEAWPPLHASSASDRPHVVGTVGFLGEMNGLIYLYLDLEFARICTKQLLGMTDAELDATGDECVNDAVAELTNMSVGGFKNSLCDLGFPCKLTIPSILRGTSFRVVPTGAATRHIYHFDCKGHRVVTDILMKYGD